METVYINDNTEIRVVLDEYPRNPREDDNLGIMACMHRRYDLGDEQLDPNQFDSWVEVINHLQREGAVVMLPLYLYDHSGITIATTPFSCPWDSGRVGFIYATAHDIRECFSIKRVTQKVKDQVTEFLKSEVKEYDQYLRGEVYTAELLVDDEVIDRLHGCYDEEHALEMGYELLDQHGIKYESIS
jgi:hypothetical protein